MATLEGVPRTRCGGSHRPGQGIFANRCRGGPMVAPMKPWRKWHRKINVKLKRYALVLATAASGVPTLVHARDHVIDGISEFPLIVSDKIQEHTKTKQAVIFWRRVKAGIDVKKVYKSQRFRTGRGKMRNRRCIQSKGPLTTYFKDDGIHKAFRNSPGVETTINKLNLLKFGSGDHVGRFVIWTQSAFDYSNNLFETWTEVSKLKRYTIFQHQLCQTPTSSACSRPPRF